MRHSSNHAKMLNRKVLTYNQKMGITEVEEDVVEDDGIVEDAASRYHEFDRGVVATKMPYGLGDGVEANVSLQADRIVIDLDFKIVEKILENFDEDGVRIEFPIDVVKTLMGEE